MRAIRSLLKYIYGDQPEHKPLEDSLDYEQVVHLDAEDLAEQGIQSAYAELLPNLKGYVNDPLDVTEELDNELGSYTVLAGGTRYEIWGANLTADCKTTTGLCCGF